MERVLVFWSRPAHLSADEAEAWVREELEGLLRRGDVARAGLTRLEPASSRHARPCDWMLELELPPGADVATCLDSRLWKEWLADLRLLGMRPSVMVPAGHAEIEGDAG